MLELIFGLALASTPIQPVLATPLTEGLGVDAPDDFQISYHFRDGTVDMWELVKPPETVDHWTRLITSQILFGIGGSFDNFYAHWVQAFTITCPGVVQKSSVDGSVDGLRAIKSETFCPRNPKTGLPESLVAVTIDGRANILVFQVAFRRQLSDEDKAFSDQIIGSLRVCDLQSIKACSTRRGTGFVIGIR